MRGIPFVCGLLLCITGSAAADPVPAIAYHDIVRAKNGDPYALTVEDFRRHMRYLVHAGYHPISLQALARARDGKEALPEKPVLLTFDDGYKSYHDIVYPILREYGFPSVISVVTSWIDRRSAPDYISAEFMTWDELRALARSPLVEVLSHTDDLHRNVVADPAGARMPAAETYIYDPKTGAYESEAAHRLRVSADLARSVKRIRDELGIAPAGITWPYGRYDGPALEAAAKLGMTYYLTLDDEPTQLAALPRINRTTFRNYRALADLGDALTFKGYRRRQLRFVEFDLAIFADKDPTVTSRLIVELERRVELLHVNAVVLRPFTVDGAGAYFHTDAMPVAADVLSQIAFQLTERAGLNTLILRVPASMGQRVYADLARLNWFSGIVIEDAADRDEFERTAALFRHYKPALKVGSNGDLPWVDAIASFSLVDLVPNLARETLREQIDLALQRSSRPLFMLERAPAMSLDALRGAMAALRTAGAIHYGYGPDDFLHNDPKFLRIVRPLAEYTIPPRR